MAASNAEPLGTPCPEGLTLDPTQRHPRQGSVALYRIPDMPLLVHQDSPPLRQGLSQGGRR